MVYYIVGISHQLTFGGQYTTTLSLKFGRKPWEVLPELMNFDINASALSAETVVRDQAATTLNPYFSDNEVVPQEGLLAFRVTWIYQKSVEDVDLYRNPPDATFVAGRPSVFVNVYGVSSADAAKIWSRKGAANQFNVSNENDPGLQVLRIDAIPNDYATDTMSATDTPESIGLSNFAKFKRNY